MIKQAQMDILERKNTVSEIKNSVDRFNVDLSQPKNYKLKDRLISRLKHRETKRGKIQRERENKTTQEIQKESLTQSRGIIFDEILTENF